MRVPLLPNIRSLLAMDKEKDRNDMKSAKHLSVKDPGLIDPEIRLKTLSTRGEAVEMDHNTPLRRYYRSGVEMDRMAKVYLKEGNLEEAYLLYHKFMTLFLEKVRRHPEYNEVPVKDRASNQKMLREILPKAEALKVKLLEQYRTDTLRYIADVREREKAELERSEQERKRRLREEEDRKNKLAAVAAAKAVKAALNSSVLGGPEVDILQPSVPTHFPSIAAEFDPLAISTTADRKTPSIDRSTKPFAQDKQILRDVVLPSRTMREFLLLAFKNTTNNKETCGVLAGKLERNKLLVTHLLIPQQTGSPDSCATHNEEDIFDYQDQHNLITLGWIHTHPTQTAFLSSVDLHTHCAYQLMMAEAIAIVCAPKYDETGYFMLTPEYGLNFIASCRQSGFHPHPTEPPLYTNATHCKLSPTADVEVVDLRRK